MGYYVKNRVLQSGTTAVVVPVGTTAEQPTAPVAGMLRYNSSDSNLEFYNGTQFQSLASAGAVSYVQDSFTGDGTTVTYTMSHSVTDPAQIFVFVGSLYQIATTNYTVSGTSITFTSAPPNGSTIIVIHTNG
jgi:hypothetical protein